MIDFISKNLTFDEMAVGDMCRNARQILKLNCKDVFLNISH